jgi:hypothetical protein
VNFDDFKISGNPTEDQLRAVYSKNQKIIPERRDVSYVLIPAKMDSPDGYDKGSAAAQKLEDALIGGEPMESAAKKFSGKFVSAAVSTKSGDEIIAKNYSRILDMEQGVESEITETKNGFVIFRVEKIEPAHAAEFDSVKTEMTGLWRKEEQKKQAYVKANECLTAFNGLKEAIDKFIETNKVCSGVKAATVSRADGAPLAVLNAAFANSIGAKVIVPDSGSFFVLSVAEEIAPAADAKKLAEMRAESQKMLSRMLSDDYTAFLSREYPVKVNEKVYRKLMGGGGEDIF